MCHMCVAYKLSSPSQLVALEPCLLGKRGDLLLEMTCQPRKVAKTGIKYFQGKLNVYRST